MLIIITLFELAILLVNNSVGLSVSTLNNSVIIILLTLLYFFALEKDPKLIHVNKQIMAGLFLRTVLLFFDRFGRRIYMLPNSGADSEGFYRSAVLYSKNSTQHDYGLFIKLMGTVMRYVGTNRLISQYVVVIFSLFSLVYISYALYELKIDVYVQKEVIGIVSLIPNFAILGAIFLRESIVTMLIAISCYTLAKWFKQKSNMYFLLSLLFVVLSALFHSGTLGIICGFLIIRFVYDNQNERLRLDARNVMVSILFFLVFAFAFINYKDILFTKLSGVESIEDIANTSHAGRTSYARYVGNSASIINLIIYTPLRFIYFLFSPFPWQWTGFSDIIAFVFSSMFYFYSLLVSIKAITTEREKNVIFILWIIVAFSVTFVFAWGVSNTGTAIRHRDKLIPFYAILIACAINNHKKRELKKKTYLYIKE